MEFTMNNTLKEILENERVNKKLHCLFRPGLLRKYTAADAEK